VDESSRKLESEQCTALLTYLSCQLESASTRGRVGQGKYKRRICHEQVRIEELGKGTSGHRYYLGHFNRNNRFGNGIRNRSGIFGDPGDSLGIWPSEPREGSRGVAEHGCQRRLGQQSQTVVGSTKSLGTAPFRCGFLIAC